MSSQHAGIAGPTASPHLPSRVLALGATLVALACTLLLAACGAQVSAAGNNALSAPTAPAIGHVTITAHDDAFDLPRTVPAGPVELTFVNQGDQVHQAQFFHLNQGVTPAQFIAALTAGGPASTRSLAAPWGGADETAPHQPAVHVIEVLAPGTYVVACLVRGPDGMFHYQMGMVGSFTVAGSGAPAAYSPPDDGTVTEVEMSVTLPAALSQVGRHTFKVVNAGTTVHALDILRLAPGTTAQDVETYLNTPSPSGPPPFVLLGGVGGMHPGSGPGGTQWLLTNLAPGNYVAACLVVDPVSHKTHAAMGMLTGFTVA